jgi:hypothetical protein
VVVAELALITQVDNVAELCIGELLDPLLAPVNILKQSGKGGAEIETPSASMANVEDALKLFADCLPIPEGRGLNIEAHVSSRKGGSGTVPNPPFRASQSGLCQRGSPNASFSRPLEKRPA